MAKAKKLPSGSWRVQVFHYKDVDGKRHYMSFTASTKREAEFLAAQWAATGKTEPQHEDITLYEAITRYINSKRNVLSPSTLRGYEGMQRNYFKTIGRAQLKSLDNTTLQIWISDLSKHLSSQNCAQYTRLTRLHA